MFVFYINRKIIIISEASVITNFAIEPNKTNYASSVMFKGINNQPEHNLINSYKKDKFETENTDTDRVIISEEPEAATPVTETKSSIATAVTPSKPKKSKVQNDEFVSSKKQTKNKKSKFEKALNIAIIGAFIGIMIAAIAGFARNKRVSGGIDSTFGDMRNFAKKQADSKSKITFKDVAGIDEEKKELQEIVDFLKNPQKYKEIGAKLPKGVLLSGPPGTGKTLMAKAIAGEANVPFYYASGSDFDEIYVGVGAGRIRSMFEQAKKHQPCIIFIDEIDAVGAKRLNGPGGKQNGHEQTLNQLLTEMDGFEENSNVIVIAATNRPEILDSALLRPGRFDRQISVSLPDVKGREEILKVHAQGKKLASDVDLKAVAIKTGGFSGAELQGLMNEAALAAARRNASEISMNDIDNSFYRVLAGVEKAGTVLSEADKQKTAYHEIGHALIAKLLNKTHELDRVTIIPRGEALGITWTTPKDNVIDFTKEDILARITQALGGRAAEEIMYDANNVGTGASQDIQRATNLAYSMVTEWGMSDLGMMAYNKNVCSPETEAKIDAEVKKIIDEQYKRAIDLLKENKNKLEKIANELVKKETLTAKEFDKLMQVA